MQGQIKQIVLTGSSAAGKTMALGFLAENLPRHGYHVLCCPESASIILGFGLEELGGAADRDPERFYQMQLAILILHRQLREHVLRQAQQLGGEVVVLFDRGELDCLAYTGPELFSRMLQEHGLDQEEILNSYHGVVHLPSIACSKPWLYHNNNNPARWESVEQAKTSDQKIRQAWQAAPGWTLVEDGELGEKMNNTLSAVLALLRS